MHVSYLVQIKLSSIVCSDLATTNDTPLSKIWKSKLKEHLDRQYKHDKISIDYKTEEHPKGGFKSTVICGDIVRAEGLGTNKGIAEHNAAYNALKKLPN